MAAELYDRALHAMEPNVDVLLLLQCGHMHKEARSFAEAKARYLRRSVWSRRIPEVLIELGHFFKVIGRYTDAEHYYQEALIARPDWADPEQELHRLRLSAELRGERVRLERFDQAGRLAQEELYEFDGRIDPGLFPRTRDELYIAHQDAFIFMRNGVRQRTKWGAGQTVRGIDLLRGFFVSATPYLYLEIFLDGQLIYKNELTVAPQRREKSNPNIKKYVYNAWIDFSDFSLGLHELVFRAVNVRGDARELIDWRREQIIIAEPLADAFASSDGVIPPLDRTSLLSGVEQINARPSIIHRASTRSFPGKIENVAVIGPDELGDMVVSVPALLRLREILPKARLVGLFGPEGAPLARTLGIFDEIIVLDFPYMPHQRQRIMDRKGQAELAKQARVLQVRRRHQFPGRGRVSQAAAFGRRAGYDQLRRRTGVAQSEYDDARPEDRERYDAALGEGARVGGGPGLVARQRRQGRPPNGSQPQPASAIRPRQRRTVYRSAYRSADQIHPMAALRRTGRGDRY